MTMNRDGPQQVTGLDLVQVVLAEDHAGILLHLEVEEGVKLEETLARKAQGRPPGSFLKPAHHRRPPAFGVVKYPLCPITERREVGGALMQAQGAGPEMRNNIVPQAAK